MPRQLHLNAFIHDIGHHEAAWRLPESDPFATTDIDFYVGVTQMAERAGFDSIFFADSPGLAGDPRFRPVGALEPTTLLAALAQATGRIGLIATCSTTYNEPYELARRFASLDHISAGRVGWNIVTTASADAARNFGLDDHGLHHDRYLRAEEFLDVVKALWDSWEDDARRGDKASGEFADPRRIHAIDHRGEFFSVAGPLDIPRTPQGWPLLVQAGSSEDGRSFAGRHAEAVFTVQRSLAEGQDFYADVKRRAVAAGRLADDIVILPGVVPFLGSTEAEAREREAQFEERIIPAYGLRQLSRIFDTDLSGVDLDGPLPEVPQEAEVEGFKSRSAVVEAMARSEQLTVRQLLGRLGGGRGHRSFTGTPEQLAADIELWFRRGAADGFNIMAPAIPADLELFIAHVLPILRRRGLFREAYSASTLRGHYGLKRPAGRHAPALA